MLTRGLSPCASNHNTYELFIDGNEISSYHIQDSQTIIFSRPNINGYHDRLFTMLGDYREFPFEFDEKIVRYGTMKTIGNSSSFIAPGRVNGHIGLYNITSVH